MLLSVNVMIMRFIPTRHSSFVTVYSCVVLSTDIGAFRPGLLQTAQPALLCCGRGTCRVFQATCSPVQLLGCKVCISSLTREHQNLSKVVVLILSAADKHSCFPMFLLILDNIRLDICQACEWLVISRYGFNLHFPDIMRLGIFIVS